MGVIDIVDFYVKCSDVYGMYILPVGTVTVASVAVGEVRGTMVVGSVTFGEVISDVVGVTSPGNVTLKLNLDQNFLFYLHILLCIKHQS